MALNYLHGGMRPIPLVLLGREPNAVHLDIDGWLRALLTACDRPDAHPLPPGRSGYEFIARLIELEHFAGSHTAVNLILTQGKKVPALHHSREQVRFQRRNRFRNQDEFSGK